MADDCPFCVRIGRGEYDEEWVGAVSFPPLNPVTPGHMLVVATEHVSDATSVPSTTAAVMYAAAYVADDLGENCNIITSVGPAATQTVEHLHIHVVPRRVGDGLALPWSAHG